ncbi:hypothetical protein [Priestia megaterium]|uniref:hypothetical protein n=1 Tax=Priestia megaterium TaxID=1404 RepID=UPI002DBC345C|nr:hypothetical protein [Priestia megaterium]MEC1071412.1 hypothetical protein [Priestia megaterium]
MIQMRAKSLHQLIDKKQILRAEQNYIEAYKLRRNQLQNEVERVIQLCQMINLMWKYEICTKDYKDELQTLRSIAVKLKEQFEESPEWIKGQGALRPLKLKIDSIKKEIEEEIKTKWEEYVKKGLPSVHNDMLTVLGKIPSFSVKVDRIRILNREIYEQMGNIPVLERNLKDVITKKNELIEEWNSLGADDVPAAVLRFIRSAASDQGALLTHLTPEVLLWLKQFNIQSFFKIRMQ